jgi:hypothetical protein
MDQEAGALIAFWLLIPAIDRQGHIFGLLSGLVAVGGLARAFTAFRLGSWGLPARAAAGHGIGRNAGSLAVAPPRLFTFGSRTPIFPASSIRKTLTWH